MRRLLKAQDEVKVLQLYREREVAAAQYRTHLVTEAFVDYIVKTAKTGPNPDSGQDWRVYQNPGHPTTNT